MQSDHAKPAAAFVVLVVLAAATVGSGLSHQDADGADRTATAPAPGPDEERPADRLTPFDPTRPVTLAPRPTSDSASGAAPAAGETAPAVVSRAGRPSRSRTGDSGATGSRTGTGSGAETRSWSPGHGQGKARGHGSSTSGRKRTPQGHR